jgi:hypothetical protein
MSTEEKTERDFGNKSEIDSEKLCFIKFIGETNEGNEYEFYFTENIENVWGDDFNTKPSFLIPDIFPYDDCYNLIKKVYINKDIVIDLATSDSCHSFQDCIDGIIALASQNIDDEEVYPDEGRLIFKFGENYNSVEEKLSKRDAFFSS